MWTASSRGVEIRAFAQRWCVCALGAMAFMTLVATPSLAGSREKVEKQLAKRYPVARYVVSVGQSEAGPEQAEAHARAEVAAQVRSELTAVLTTEESSTTKDGLNQYFQQIVSRTESRTSFKHGELILNDPKLAARDGRIWIAVGVLDRDEAARAMQQEYDMQAVEFRSVAKVLLDGDRPLPEWTATLRRAEIAFQDMLIPAFGMRALKREPERFESDFERFQRIEAERTRRLAGVRIGLAVEGVHNEVRPLVSRVGEVLAKLGLGSAPAGCPSGGYQLQIVPQLVSESGMFGPVVRLSLSGSLVRCDGHEPIGSISVSNADFIGTDTRDRNRAMDSLWEQVSTDRLLPLLRAELARYLPVSEM